MTEYDYLTEEDIKLILLDQARQIETLQFQHELYKPNKLAQNNASYLEWENKKYILDNQMKAVKKKVLEYGYTNEDLMSLMTEKKEENL